MKTLDEKKVKMLIDFIKLEIDELYCDRELTFKFSNGISICASYDTDFLSVNVYNSDNNFSILRANGERDFLIETVKTFARRK